MPARSARLGSVHPPSSYLVVAGRGRGLLFALALTGFAVTLLSQFDTAEASACDRTGPRSGVREELEGLLQRPLEKGTLSSVISRLQHSSHGRIRKTRVQCVYFTEWPPHTYCLVRNPTELYANLTAHLFCTWTLTDPISMIYTPMYRICRLMRFFGIKDSRLLIQDTLQQSDIIGWEDCYFRAENETKPTVNCSSCNVSVICEDRAIYSNVSRCVTRAEGDKDVEYCYNYDKANATEATERCAQDSSMLVDMKKMDEATKKKLRLMFFFDQESWVDLKEEDVSEVSGVFSKDFAEIDWTSSCTTVWLKFGVPWFFVRNCSDLYPVLCQDIDAWGHETDYEDEHLVIDDCGDSNWKYCFSGERTFDRTTAAAFCANYSFSVLNATPLRTVFFFFRFFSTSFRYPVIWDAGSTSDRQNDTDTCYAIDVEHAYKVIEYKCSEELGYFCMKSKPRATNDFDCEYANMAESSRRPVCVSNVGKDFADSVKDCAKMGMDLLPAGLDHKEYTAIVNNYFLQFMVPRPHPALWVDASQRMDNDSCWIVSDWNTFSFHSAECEKSVGSTLCVFSNEEMRPTAENTSIQAISGGVEVT
ncbi:hypothetical protein MTO96_025477 [Rhipicephalus appendiculatus]